MHDITGIEMPKPGKETTMGGIQNVFQTTHWSEIYDAKTDDDTRRTTIIGNLLGRYWKPVYCYLIRKGYANEVAKDLTQGFFHEIVLERDLIRHADPAKGRFRAFLLTALDRYAISVHRRDTRRKRRPMGAITELDVFDIQDLPAGQLEATPEQVFNYAWATDLLDKVIAEVRDDYCSMRRETYWEVFREKILDPLVGGVEAPSLSEICTRYAVESEQKASNMIATVKRRFRAVLRRFLRQLVHSDSEVEEELTELLRIVSKSSTR